MSQTPLVTSQWQVFHHWTPQWEISTPQHLICWLQVCSSPHQAVVHRAAAREEPRLRGRATRSRGQQWIREAVPHGRWPALCTNTWPRAETEAKDRCDKQSNQQKTLQTLTQKMSVSIFRCKQESFKSSKTEPNMTEACAANKMRGKKTHFNFNQIERFRGNFKRKLK